MGVIEGGHGEPAGVPGARSGLPKLHCHLRMSLIVATVWRRLLLYGDGVDHAAAAAALSCSYTAMRTSLCKSEPTVILKDLHV